MTPYGIIYCLYSTIPVHIHYTVQTIKLLLLVVRLAVHVGGEIIDIYYSLSAVEVTLINASLMHLCGSLLCNECQFRTIILLCFHHFVDKHKYKNKNNSSSKFKSTYKNNVVIYHKIIMYLLSKKRTL